MTSSFSIALFKITICDPHCLEQTSVVFKAQHFSPRANQLMVTYILLSLPFSEK